MSNVSERFILLKPEGRIYTSPSSAPVRRNHEAACFAELEHEVVNIDIDEDVVDTLNAAESPATT
jgi:hypothetical protein